MWTPIPEEAEAFLPFQNGAVVVRIDGVTHLHDGVLRLIQFAISRNMGLSLEIPPFSPRISEHEIEVVAGTSHGLKIGQHGFVRTTISQSPNKPPLLPTADSDGQISALSSGKLYIEQQFGPLFSGGYSAPDDLVSAWIAFAWLKRGGQFISFVTNRPRGARLRTVRLGTRWQEFDQENLQKTILGEIRQALSQVGYAGLVLHEQQLRSIEVEKHVESFLQTLQEVGLSIVCPDTQARLQAEALLISSNRDYRGGVVPNER